ncbi:nitrous oxide reductase family maturation protein NosD [Shewanella sp. GXUN23E]|uniref:nitrous oxide reductase family maturation protein NosD n=1 Tax=Shewanella sp. GXUN23E TaxID=3422498 RepID=UPI003D7EE4FA
MSKARALHCSLLLALLSLLNCVQAAQLQVSPADDLQAVLDNASDGDTVLLAPGEYAGNFHINSAIHLRGTTDPRDESALPAIINAGGKGSAISVAVPGVTLSNLKLFNYGADSYYLDSGVLLLDGAHDAVIRDNVFYGPGFGVRGDNLNNPRVTGNRITGDKRLHKLDRGDGIYFKRVDDPHIEGNVIREVRDGVYLETVNRSVAFDNQFSHQQYGLHYMYTRDDEAWHNHAEQMDGAWALMSSERIYLHHNSSENTLDFGILLNLTHHSRIEANQVRHSRNPKGDVAIMTEGKGIFIYGAKGNQVQGNLFEDNDTGVNLAMGGEGNRLWDNTLTNNTAQVKYVGDKQVEWSHEGRGNFWDDYQGWDFNRDGVGDIAHRPNDSLDKLFWIYPEAKLLMDSPVVALLRWVERQFAPTSPSGINDSFPLMAPATAPGEPTVIVNRS